MTGTKIVLELRAESKEGIHDFIPILEEVIEDIKGGYEKRKLTNCSWNLIPVV